MKESEDKKQSFVKDLFKRARRSETHDINDNRKGFAARNARYILGLTVAVVGAASLPAGFGMDFLQMAATILSVFIGLFIAALVFALDKYAPAPDSAERDYRLEISEGDTCRNVELSVDEIEYPDSRTKNARRQTHIYMAQFNAITGKSVLLSVWALALLCLNILYPHLFATAPEPPSQPSGQPPICPKHNQLTHNLLHQSNKILSQKRHKITPENFVNSKTITNFATQKRITPLSSSCKVP